MTNKNGSLTLTVMEKFIICSKLEIYMNTRE